MIGLSHDSPILLLITNLIIKSICIKRLFNTIHFPQNLCSEL
nr:MAG TPA: hypothetical protein [Caudoviricetes sp.]